MTTLVKKSEEQIPNANQPRNGLEQLATPKKNIKTFDPATIDWDAIVTEDDTPVENYNTEQHGGLLTDTLYTNWLHSKYGNRFIAAADVGVFSAPDEPAIVPDIFLSLGLQKPADKSHKRNRSYFIWDVGKQPDVVIEIVSNDEGGEDTTKMARYARLEIPYYAIYDPQHELSDEVLRFYVLRGRRYVEVTDTWMPEVELGLTLWQGFHQGVEGQWLRWCDRTGAVIPTAAESSLVAQERAEQERIRAEQERTRAEQEKAKAERLAARLRALGITDIE